MRFVLAGEPNVIQLITKEKLFYPKTDFRSSMKINFTVIVLLVLPSINPFSMETHISAGETKMAADATGERKKPVSSMMLMTANRRFIAPITPYSHF